MNELFQQLVIWSEQLKDHSDETVQQVVQEMRQVIERYASP